jgi:hypothetical protein
MPYPFSPGDQLYASDLNSIRREVAISSDKTTDYTLQLGDAGAFLEINKATAINVTVPPNSSVAFPIGTRIALRQKGAGQVTIVAGSGVTLQSYQNALKTAGQHATAFIVKVGTDTWVVDGTVVP